MDDSAANNTGPIREPMPLWIAWAAAIPIFLATGEAAWQAIRDDSLSGAVRAVGLTLVANFVFTHVRSLPRCELKLSVTNALCVLGIVALGVSAALAIAIAMAAL